MGEAITDGTDSTARALARVAEPFHAVSYYSRECADWSEAGYKGWWHAYFAYRPAPMGAVTAPTVTAAFYNFAPRMVERAVPGVWDIHSPAEATAIRLERVEAALGRIFGTAESTRQAASEALELIRPVGDAPGVARPVYAGYADLEWPSDPILGLWHGCTLLREYRGDSHNIALADAEVDGVACHVLMVGRGHGNRPTITAIRGWTDEEWAVAVDDLRGRGWIDADGALTEAGNIARKGIEQATDRLMGDPVKRLGEDGTARLIELVRPMVDQLANNGEVSGRWPPEHVMKPAEG
ncbi:MAG: SCO6745 family protein [Acidimicrobiales bacterium]